MSDVIGSSEFELRASRAGGSNTSTVPIACEKQPRRELPSADPTTRATAAGFQIPGLSPEVPHHPRRNLQHLQRPASPDQPTDPLPLPSRGGRHMGGGDDLNRCGRGKLCLGAANLTAPTVGFVRDVGD